jgi:hypothetical protein
VEYEVRLGGPISTALDRPCVQKKGKVSSLAFLPTRIVCLCASDRCEHTSNEKGLCFLEMDLALCFRINDV